MSTTVYRYALRGRAGQKKSASPFLSVSGRPLANGFRLDIECRLESPGTVQARIGETSCEEAVGAGGHRIGFDFDGAPPAGDALLHLVYRASAPRRRLLATGANPISEITEDWGLEAVTQANATHPTEPIAAADIEDSTTSPVDDPSPDTPQSNDDAVEALAELQERLRGISPIPTLPLPDDPSALQTMITGWRERAQTLDEEPLAPPPPPTAPTAPPVVAPEAPTESAPVDPVADRIDALENRMLAMEERLLKAMRSMEERLAAIDRG